MDYAIFKTGGKQYRVSPGDIIDVEKLPVEPGAEIELENVLALSQDGEVTYGQPVIEGAKVITDAGAETVKIIATIDREEGARENIEGAGYTFEALFTVGDLGIER